MKTKIRNRLLRAMWKAKDALERAYDAIEADERGENLAYLESQFSHCVENLQQARQHVADWQAEQPDEVQSA
jgi:hypothetical protein